MKSNRNAVVIFVLFYVGWFGCVLLAQSEVPGLTLIFPLLLVVFLVATGQLRKPGTGLALFLTACGSAFDWGMLQLGWITAKGLAVGLLPYWLLAIWLLFAFSMVPLGARLKVPLWVASGLGAVMGPLSYKSGELFEVLHFVSPWTTVGYAGFWALFFPLTLFLARRWA